MPKKKLTYPDDVLVTSGLSEGDCRDEVVFHLDSHRRRMDEPAREDPVAVPSEEARETIPDA